MAGSAPATTPPPAPGLPTTEIKLPAIRLTPITDQANADILAQVREGYSNKVALGASSAGGGTGYVKGSISKDHLAASGYVSYARATGAALGGEVVLTLGEK
jgi:hypothetical protein